MDNKLPTHEWSAISILLIVFFTIFLVSFRTSENVFPQDPQTTTYYLKDPSVLVSIEGAVEHPGEYKVIRGTSLRKVLELANPLPEANLSRYKLDSPVNRKRKLNIKARKSPQNKRKS